MRRARTGAAVVAAALAVLLVAGCASTAGSITEADLERLTATGAKYAQAVSAKDIDLYMSLWDDDGVQMPPDMPAVIGKAAIRERMIAVWSKQTAKMTTKREDRILAGDYVINRGSYSSTITLAAGGDPIQFEGKNLTVWHRHPDGSWRIHFDCYNSNKPAR